MDVTNTLMLASYCGLFIFLCTTFGAAFVFFLFNNKGKIYTHLSLGFSAGIMLAASVFSLLIPAIDLSTYEGTLKIYPVIGGFILGILFLILIDKSLPHLHILSKYPEGPKSSFSKTTLLFLAITIHNIPEGMAVGVCITTATDLSLTSSAAVLALGIGIQNIPEGAAVSIPYFADGMSRIKAFVLGSLSGLVEPFAAIFMVVLSDLVSPLLPWFLSFAAGAMMYVVIEELIPQSHNLGNSDKGTISVLIGFMLMMFLDITLN